MKKELKVVIDTNVIISAVIGRNPTLIKIYNAFINNLFTPVFSPSLQEEIFNVIKRPRIRRYFRGQEIEKFEELIKVDAIFVIPTKKLSLCRDPKDNIVLETAIARANFIVTGDKDLLILKSCLGIPIINPREFATVLSETGKI